MAILFHCTHCKQFLRIASRKAGADVSCPHCAQLIKVPDTEEQLHGTKSVHLPEPRIERKTSRFENTKFPPQKTEESDNIEMWLEGFWSGDVHHVSAPPIKDPFLPGDVLLDSVKDPEMRDILKDGVSKELVSSVIFSRFALCFVLLLIGFVLGIVCAPYLSPILSRISQNVTNNTESNKKSKIIIETTANYQNFTGQTKCDAYSVAILLPVNSFPESPISVIGLRSTDRAAEKNKAAIEAFGGFYQRANSLGSTTFLIPDPAEYHILIISAHAKRKIDSNIDAATLVTLSKYLINPEYLIGEYKYSMKQVYLDENTPLFEDHFGISEQTN